VVYPAQDLSKGDEHPPTLLMEYATLYLYTNNAAEADIYECHQCAARLSTAVI